MSAHDDATSLRQMLDHAREALVMVRRKVKEDLRRDRMLELALTRLVEIIGEAASRLSAETRQKHPEIPWPEILGMRNRLAHGYDVLDLDLLWDTVCDDLPPLIAALEQILDNDSS